MALAAILLVLYSINLSSGYFVMDDDDINDTLTLPSEYYLRAEMIDLMQDLYEPLELWYSAENNRSRIDVSGGMVKRYYHFEGDHFNTGKVYSIFPKTTEKKENERACVVENIIDESRNHEAFPTEDFEYAGTKQHEGKTVDVWESISEGREAKIEEYMYTYKAGKDVDVPVQYIKKYSNVLKGKMETHKLYNYFDYNPIVQPEDLNPDKDLICDVTSDDFHGKLKSLHPALTGDVDIAFNAFKSHHSKIYRNSDEHKMRKEIFEKNWRLVMKHNSQGLGFKLALNHLSDRTAAELRRMNGARRSPDPAGSLPFPLSKEEVDARAADLPEEYDMRLEGFISPVKNQGSCGSCWSFATAAAVEGTLARLDGRILDLSEQTLIDCDWTEPDRNSGCNGGFAPDALRFVMKHGLPLDEDYGSYLSQNGYCHLRNVSQVFKIRGFTLVTPLSAAALRVALVDHGPVVAYIQANDKFSYYSSGIFYDATCVNDRINHAITIVGYGVRDGVRYWIVKNSYGEGWGEDGYMLLSATNNNCFVLNESYYAVV